MMIHKARLAFVCAALAAAPVAAQSADTSAVYDAASVTVLPRPLNAPDLVAALNATYPPAILAAGLSGRVQVAFVVGADGVPRDLRVEQSVDSAFNAPTVAAVQVLRFAPARVEGRAVSVRVQLPVDWTLPPAPEPVAAVPAPGWRADTIYELSQITDQPRPLNSTVLVREMERMYPETLRDAGIEGTVQVRFVVSPTGEPSGFLVTHTSNILFNHATVLALTKLRFRPGRLNGKPVAVWVELPVQWSVQGTAGMPPGVVNRIPPPCVPSPQRACSN